jgi:hypothetical protein
MTWTARSWSALAVAAATVGALGFAGATASAEPVIAPVPNPAPAPPLAARAAPGPVGNVIASTPSPAVSAPVPDVSGTIRDYFHGKDVTMEPQQAEGFRALDVTLPMPPRWTAVPDPNVVDPFTVIADRSGNSLYTSNAQVVVYRLVGDFDPGEAIGHSLLDSRQLPAWRTTNAALADFGGFPSSITEGTYRQDGMALHTSRRDVIATAGGDRYLVSLAVTTAAARAVAEASATGAIVNGFRVSAASSVPGPSGPGPPR